MDTDSSNLVCSPSEDVALGKSRGKPKLLRKPSAAKPKVAAAKPKVAATKPKVATKPKATTKPKVVNPKKKAAAKKPAAPPRVVTTAPRKPAGEKLRDEIKSLRCVNADLAADRKELRALKSAAEVEKRKAETQTRKLAKELELAKKREEKRAELLAKKRAKNPKRVNAVARNRGMCTWIDAAKACGYLHKGAECKPMPREGTEGHAQIRAKMNEMYSEYMFSHPADAKTKLAELYKAGNEKLQKIVDFLDMYVSRGETLPPAAASVAIESGRKLAELAAACESKK